MTKLTDQKCIPCEGGVPPLKGEELENLKAQLDEEAPGWELKTAKHLIKTYKFPDFQSALDFVNKVGASAEEEGHHPNISFGWGFVTVTIWTHKIDGLSDADFVLAAKVDRLIR